MANRGVRMTSNDRLKYKKGDLIIKEGDYGVSIYSIVSGKVRIFTQTEETEVELVTVGPGEILGEMIFLTGSTELRSASARALEDCELEVWHPDRLSKEYGEMPAIIKYITRRALKRLLRMNKLMAGLAAKRAEKEQRSQEDSVPSRRLFCRKQVDSPCTYRPVGSSERFRMFGRVKDLSLTGVGLDISARNWLNCSYISGDEFVISAVLPNRKELDVTAKVVSVRKIQTSGKFYLGMSITDMAAEDREKLSFFLMP